MTINFRLEITSFWFIPVYAAGIQRPHCGIRVRLLLPGPRIQDPGRRTKFQSLESGVQSLIANQRLRTPK